MYSAMKMKPLGCRPEAEAVLPFNPQNKGARLHTRCDVEGLYTRRNCILNYSTVLEMSHNIKVLLKTMKG